VHSLIRKLYKIKIFKRIIPSLVKLYINLFKKEDLIITNENILINLNLTNPIDREIYLKGTYEKEQLDFLSKLIDDYKINFFLDIGAHHGFYSLNLSKKNISIYSFEPVKQNFERLKKNIKINNLTNIKTYNLALSNLKKKIKMWVPDKFKTGGFSIINKDDEELKKYTTGETFKINSESELADNIINFVDQKIAVKMDVERHEVEVLEGMTKTIDRNYIILQVEIFDQRKDKVLKYLDKKKFKFLRNIKKDYFFKNF